jgi:hypothetical protein
MNNYVFSFVNEMLRQAQHDKIEGKFGVDGHANLKDLKDLFGLDW